jgi:hypothetical protein
MDMTVDSFDPVKRNEVMLSVGAIFSREFDRAPFKMIDDADLLSAGRDDVHMFFDTANAQIGSLGRAAQAGFVFHELDCGIGALGDCLANGLCGVGRSLAGIGNFIFNRTSHDKFSLEKDCRGGCRRIGARIASVPKVGSK